MCEKLNGKFKNAFTQGPQLWQDYIGRESWKLLKMVEKNMNKVLELLYPNMAYGPNEVYPFLLKECAEMLARPFEILFIRSLEECIVPSLWKLADFESVFEKCK